MVASKNTIQQVVETIDEYLDEQSAYSLLNKLVDIKGNKSYEETVRLIRDGYLKHKGLN